MHARSCCCAACPYPQAPPADPTIVLDLNDPDSLAAWQLAMEGQPSESLQQLQLTYTSPAAHPLSHPRRGRSGPGWPGAAAGDGAGRGGGDAGTGRMAAPAAARTLEACLPGLICSISALRLYQLGDTPRGWDHWCRPMRGCDFRPMRPPVPAGADWEPEEPSGGGDVLLTASAPMGRPWGPQRVTEGAGASPSGRHLQSKAAAGSVGATCAGRHLVLLLRGIRGEVPLSVLEAALLQVGDRSRGVEGMGGVGGAWGTCGEALGLCCWWEVWGLTS